MYSYSELMLFFCVAVYFFGLAMIFQNEHYVLEYKGTDSKEAVLVNLFLSQQINYEFS